MALLTAALSVLSGCSGDTLTQRRDGNALIRLSDAEIRGLDPQKVSDLAAIRVARDQFEGLTRFNGEGEAEAGLARDWTISDDGLLWTFSLRKGLRFSDGTPLTTATFVAVWDRLQADATASPHRALFAPVEQVEAADKHTVQVVLANPYPELPALLAHPAMAALPIHRIDAAGDGWTSERPLVTSGAYRLTRWLLNDRAELQANPEWHGGRPSIEKVLWKPADDSLGGMRLVLGGAADIASDYPTNRHQWLMQNHADYVHVSDYLGTYYYAFNTRRPPFSDKKVRRALSMAVDREFLTKKLIGLGNAPADLVVPNALRRENRDSVAGQQDNLEAARALLTAAGYSDDNPLRFEIRINTSREHKRVATALAAMWGENLPVQASILNTEASLHFASLRRADFDLARSGWIADLPTAENFLAVHRSDAGAVNYSGYTNPDFDRALTKASLLTDADARKQAMTEAALQLAEDAPILPLYYYTTRSLVSPRIAGWHDNVLNIHPSRTLSFSENK